MKRPLITLLALSLLVSSSVLAADIFSGELRDDLYFPNGVKVLGVEQPQEDAEIGISSVRLDGYGSMVIGNRSTGDFPRLALIGGTTVRSERDWTNYSRKTWWDGVVQAPQPKKVIELSQVPELAPVLDRGIRLEVIGTYQWGLDNERFEYSIPARVALEVEAPDGEKVFMVAKNKDDIWTVNRKTLCSVQDNLCIFDVASIKGMSLIRRAREVAQAGSDDQFWESLFDDAAQSDNPDEFFKDLFDNMEEEEADVKPDQASGEVEAPKPKEAADYREYYDAATYQDTPAEEQRHYYLKKYGTNSNHRANLLSEEGLSEEELAKVRSINAGKLSRKLRKEPETQAKVDDSSNSRILDYLLATRNRFGEGSQDNFFGNGELLASAPDASMSRGGGFLPSTGPEFFMALAALGFVLMVIGALRRQ